MPTEVPVTPSQVKAAKRIVERDSAMGRETSEAIRKIANAQTQEQSFRSEPQLSSDQDSINRRYRPSAEEQDAEQGEPATAGRESGTLDLQTTPIRPQKTPEAMDAKAAYAARAAVAEAFAVAGSELGYAVTVCEGATTTGIELRRGREIALVRIGDDGVVESDHAALGHAGADDRIRELRDAAARRGVTLSDHGRGDGRLISAAAALGDPSLARATVVDAENRMPDDRKSGRGKQ